MSKSLSGYFFITVLSALGTLAGCASARQNPSEAQEVGAQNKGEWLKKIPDSLSVDLCAENEIFRTCFPVSEAECQQRAQALAAACEIQYKPAIPNVVSDAQGASWGARIGKCTGENLLQELDTAYHLNPSTTCQQKLDET